jgi:hypothetical protein
MDRRVILPSLAAAFALTAFCADGTAAPPWVDRTLTLPGGDWAFDFGLGVGHVPAPRDSTGVGINAEMGVGITSRIELGLRTGLRFGDDFERAINADDYGRLFDRQTFGPGAEGADVLANPEVRIDGALVRESVFELALEGRVVLPFANGTDAGLLFGVPMAFHLGSRVRLDLGAYVPTVFYPGDTTVGIHVPVDLWIQATPRLWLGPMSGVAFERVGQNNGTQNVSLGFGLGYSITHFLDLKTMFLFPDINNQSGDFGAGVGIEVRIE